MTTRECGKAAGTSRKSGEWNEPDLYSLCHTGGLPRGQQCQPGQRGILPLHCGQPCQRKTEKPELRCSPCDQHRCAGTLCRAAVPGGHPCNRLSV